MPRVTAGTIARMSLIPADIAPDLPNVRFTQRRLDNGLRVIVAPEHLAPVVAINLWYDVGSRHEVPGKTGFAHLFEHFMFQGSRHVSKSEHMSIIQGAGGVNNATTFFDRTNYFETLPSHQLDLGLWLEADRMATLLDALSQENLDNQREVVKNEKRQSYDNRPYGSFYEKLMAAVFPAEPSVSPHAHRLDGGPGRSEPGRRDQLLPGLVRAQQRGADDRGRRGEEVAFAVVPSAGSGPSPRNPDLGRSWPAELPPIIGAEYPRDGAGRGAPGAGAHLATGCRRSARPSSMPSRSAPRSWPVVAGRASTSAWCARSVSPRTWPRSRCRSWAARPSSRAG